MMEHMDIVEFLRARLDEDEREAKKCAEMFPSPWEIADRGWRVRIYAAEVPETGDHAEEGWMRSPCVIEVEPDRLHDHEGGLMDRVEHIRRHEPARVLREVEAKRRIVDSARMEVGISAAEDWLLPLLASAYAEHPDYDPAWVVVD